jgi:hypothetical protein
MYSTVSCNYVDIHFDYDWGEVGNSLYKNDVGFGMLSRETSSANSDKCFWYTENDIDMLFDIPFKISSIANTLGTLIGLMNFLYSLFLWCRVVTYLSIRFLCYVTVICIGLGILSQTVILSDMCMAGRCTQLPGPLGDTCVPSNCTLGEGSYFSFGAIGVWLASLFVTIRLLRIALQEQERSLKTKEEREDEEHGQMNSQMNINNNNNDDNNNRNTAESFEDEDEAEKEAQRIELETINEENN